MPQDTLSPGLLLGERYRLTRHVGRGGMGAVWEAVDPQQRVVAVKMLAAGLELDHGALARFSAEATATSGIAHAGVVRVIDTGMTPWGAPFLVMERLFAVTLGDLLEAQGQLTAAQAASLVVPLLDVLAATHAAGVVHRDLKPANVFVALEPSAAIRLLDFGVSRASARQTLTGTGVAFGTPAYMAPEQVTDTHGAGPAVDLYAVGAMLFEMLSGAAPSRATTRWPSPRGW